MEPTSTIASVPSAADTPAAIPAPGLGKAGLAAGGTTFALLTVGMFWYQFHLIGAADTGPQWGRLHWGYFVLILLCLPLENLASAVRTWVVYRTLQPSVGLWTCLKAEWVNVAMNTLTPSHLGGGPGQIYIFSREGVGVGSALTASLLSFVGTMVGLLCLGVYSLAFPATDAMRPLFKTTVWTLIAMSAGMVLGAIWPRGFQQILGTLSRLFWRLGLRRRPLQDWWPPHAARTGPPVDHVGPLTGKLLDLVYTYRADVGRFLCAGWPSFGWVCLLGLAFLLARAVLAYFCIRFLGIETSTWRHIIELQVALIFLLFFAPTPGGAGLAEGASMALMAQIVPVGFTPYYNLLWRASTVYLGTLAGLICFAHALCEDARRFVDRRRQ
jgi:uncharacterized membrane protein YbhN (UPF0104 family)